jgi:hypothetical protein
MCLADGGTILATYKILLIIIKVFMIRTLCLKLNLLSLHFSNCILALFYICSKLVFLYFLPNHIPNTFTLSFTSWCICGWLMVSGLPIFRISVFCSFILDPDTCPKLLNSLISSSYSEISVLIIEQSSACWKSLCCYAYLGYVCL